MSCEFCERADFGNYRAEVDNGHAHISLAGGSYRFPKNEQFAFCPMCGEPLTDPQPLTLSELRERDGKPVWVEVLEDPKANPPYWAIVDGVGYRSNGVSLISYIDKDFGAYELYGETWLAYDRPPKEDDGE